MSSSGLFENRSAFVDRLELKAGHLQKRQDCALRGGSIQSRWIDFYSHAGANRKVSPLPNLWIGNEHESSLGLTLERRRFRIDLDRGIPWPTDRTTEFIAQLGIPTSGLNPLVEFEAGAGKVVIDAATVLQMAVAPNRRVFEALTSPLSELAVIVEVSNELVLLDIDVTAFESLGGEAGARVMFRQVVPLEAARCLAHWHSNPARLARLREVVSTVQAGSQARIPELGITVSMDSDGWSQGDYYFVGQMKRPKGGAWWGGSPSAVIAVVSRDDRTGYCIAPSGCTLLETSNRLFGDDCLLGMSLDRDQISRIRAYFIA